ncbi:MAG: hypothetical protein ACD_20C00128G0006 [uncultured bacterium]|nr:MAG: hypothetical protein ACD_20C00128G0006 [uncultured bacterium]HBH19013.1 hypothetical protein [Cyanobacteria bacterium UBA9579]
MLVCSSCQAGCCRRFSIPLTGYDILKIKKALDLEYLDYTQMIKVKDDDFESESKLLSVFRFTNLGAEKHYSFFLRSIKSKYMPDSDKCIFLQEWNGEDFLLPDFRGVKARCGIYNSRPLACTIYPAKLHENELIGVAKDPNTHLDNSDNPAYNLCPRDLNNSDFLANSDEIMKNLVLYKHEKKYFKFLSEVWNQGSCDFTEFFPFLETAYQNRIIFE